MTVTFSDPETKCFPNLPPFAVCLPDAGGCASHLILMHMHSDYFVLYDRAARLSALALPNLCFNTTPNLDLGVPVLPSYCMPGWSGMLGTKSDPTLRQI